MTEENKEPSRWDEFPPVLDGFTAPDRKDQAPSPPNIFQLAGFPNRETVASRLFAWLLDPDGSHGFGSAPLEAFLACVLPNDEAIDPQSAIVSTEVATDPDTDTGHSKYIDILIELKNRSIVIENKVDAALYNQLDVYYQYASKPPKANDPPVPAYVVVLHKHDDPSIREHEYAELQWERNLFELTYDDLFDSILQHIGPTVMNADNRAIDILKQFIDNYSYIRNQEETMAADEKMSQFLDQAQGHAAGVHAFLESYQ
ncbi:MAG: PD-(D/E)XK nuclease family protein [Bifidobacterium sp.]|nr:PD-(D/E)XK nuclease family protein [Bifidobacterium sp.]